MTRRVTLLVRHRPLIKCVAGFIIGFALTLHLRIVTFVTDKTCLAQHPSGDQVTSGEKYHRIIESLTHSWTVNNITTSSTLLFVGIMTAQKFLDSRSLSIHQTVVNRARTNVLNYRDATLAVGTRSAGSLCVFLEFIVEIGVRTSAGAAANSRRLVSASEEVISYAQGISPNVHVFERVDVIESTLPVHARPLHRSI